MIMKATVKQVVDCYKALGEAKVTKLEEAEVIKIVKARKAMRAIANDFEDFCKDAQEKTKPENYEKLAELNNHAIESWSSDKSYKPTDEENEAIKILVEAKVKERKMVQEEESREVEVEFEAYKLKEDSSIKMLVENGWEARKLDLIEILL